MWELSLHVDAPPTPQPRHRIGKAKGKGGKGMMFLPESHPVHRYKLALSTAARIAAVRATQAGVPVAPFSGPLELVALFVCDKPGKRPSYGEERSWLPQKPDVDNFLKASMDAMNGVLWYDDAQVVTVSGLKVARSSWEQSHVRLMVRPAATTDEVLYRLWGAGTNCPWAERIAQLTREVRRLQRGGR